MALYRDPYARLRELAGANKYAAPVDDVSPEALAHAAAQARAAQLSQSGLALRQGTEQIKSSGLSARGLLRIGVGDEEGGLEDLRAAQAMQQAATEYGPDVQSLDDINSFGTGLEYVRNMGLQQLPNLALTVGSGGLAGAARVAAGRAVTGAAARRLGAGMAGQVAERKALRRAAEEGLPPPSSVDISRALQDRATRRAAARLSPPGTGAAAFESGAKVGAAAAGTGLQSSLAPEVVLDPDGTGTVRERAGKAALGAVATGALDVLPVMALFKKFGLTGAESAVKGALLTRMAKTAGVQGAQEAGTEVAQTVGERLAHKWVNDNVELMSPEALEEYMNAAAGGFVGGGLFGAPAGIRGAGRDSDGGKRFTATMQDYMGRFTRTPRAPLEPDVNSGGGASAAAERENEDDTAFDLGELGARVSKMTDTVAAKAAPVASKIKTEVGKVADKFKATLEGLADDEATDNSIAEILDAAPLNITDVEGVLQLNEGEGVGLFKKLIPEGRVAQLRELNPDAPLSVLSMMAMIPDTLKAYQLRADGVIAEAVKMFKGEDPRTLDDKKITAFQDALPQENRAGFNVLGATQFEGRKAGAFDVNKRGKVEYSRLNVAPAEATRTEAPTALRAEQGMDELPLPKTKAEAEALRNPGLPFVKAWRSKGGSKHVPRGTPKNALILNRTTGKGLVARHPLSGETLGAHIVARREADPEFAKQNPESQIASALSDYISEGYEIEPGSLKEMRLGQGWTIDSEMAQRLSVPGALKPTRDPNRMANIQPGEEVPAARRGPKTAAMAAQRNEPAEVKARDRELTREYGKSERPQVVTDQLDRAPPASHVPVTNVSKAPVSATGVKGDARLNKVAKAQKDRDTARTELDRQLMAIEGVTEIKSHEERMELLRSARAKVAGQPKMAKALMQAAISFRTARIAEKQAAAKVKETGIPAPTEPGKVREGVTANSGEVDAAVLSKERRASAEPELDELLREHVGHLPHDFEDRARMQGMLRYDLEQIAAGTDPDAAADLIKKRDAKVKDRKTPANRVVAEAQAEAKTLLKTLDAAEEAFTEREKVMAVNAKNRASRAFYDKWHTLPFPAKMAVQNALGIKGKQAVTAARVYKAASFTNRDELDVLYKGALKPVATQLNALVKAGDSYYMRGLDLRDRSIKGVRPGSTTQHIRRQQQINDAADRAARGGEIETLTGALRRAYDVYRKNPTAQTKKSLSKARKEARKLVDKYAAEQAALPPPMTVAQIARAKAANLPSPTDRRLQVALAQLDATLVRTGLVSPKLTVTGLAEATDNSISAEEIHRQLQREGFAATHDSPHKFDGTFDWRKHALKGEGAMVNGAGTYLSTAEGVHKAYKTAFTAKISGIDPESLAYIEMSLTNERNKLADFKEQLAALNAKPEDAYVARLFDFDPNSVRGWSSRQEVFPDEASAAKALADNDKALQKTFDDAGYTRNEYGGNAHSPFARPYQEAVDNIEADIDALEDERASYGEAEKSPTYQVSVNAKPGEIIDWDKPLSEQPEVMAKLKAAPRNRAEQRPGKDWTWRKNGDEWIARVEEDDIFGDVGETFVEHYSIREEDGSFVLYADRESRDGWTLVERYNNLQDAKEALVVHDVNTIDAVEGGYGHSGDDYTSAYPLAEMNGEALYRRLSEFLGSDRQASEYLQEIGFVGHSYPSNAGRNDKYPNYVIYDDSKITTNAVEFSNRIDASPEGMGETLRRFTGTRSRRGLYALLSRIVNSTATPTEKENLIKRVQAQIAALRAEINASGEADASQNNRRTKTAAHFKEARAKLKNVDKLEDALKALRDSATPQQKRVIDALLKNKAVMGVPFKVTQGNGRPGSVDGAHIAPMDTKGALNSRIELAIANGDPEGQSMDIVGTVLHEATHAATAYAEQTNPESRKAVEELLNHAREQARKMGVDPDAMYGLSETQEFLAEAFTNPQLQALLQSMPAKNTSKFQSLWHEFKSLVANILGLSSAEASALDEVFAIGIDMANETGAAREQAYAEIFGDSVDHSASEGYSAGPMAMTSVAGGMPTDYMMQLKPNERRFLEAAFKRGSVYRQIHDALPPDMQARLASADEGPSILVNTGIAMAMQGNLDMTYDAKTFTGLIQGLWEQISVVLGVPSRTAYARKVLAQIKAGRDPATIDAEQILLKPAALKIHRYIKGTILPKVFAITRDMDARMRSTGVPALTKLATLLSQRTGEFRSDNKQSFNERAIANRNKFLNQYFKIVNNWDEARQNAALLELQQKKANPSADARAVRAFYKDMYDYLREAGVDVGKTEDYFPVSIDPEQMIERRDEMIALLANFPDTMKKREIAPLRAKIKELRGSTDAADIRLRKILGKTINKIDRMTPREIAERFYESAVREPQPTQVGQASFATGDHKPTFKEANSRMMDFIYKEGTAAQIAQFSTFQDRNMNRVTISYVNRGVRRAEWTREGIGDQIKTLLNQAAQQGATVAQIGMAGDYVDMIMGSYGTDWHPSIKRLAQRFDFNLPPFEKMQKLNTALTTYQNLRLLPLALASSLIDPLGVAVRTGGAKGVFKAYREAARAIRDEHGDTALRRLANDMGLVERHAAVEALMHVYGGAGDPTGTAAKANAFLFRYNGLEMTTRFSRLAALSAANAFLITHSQSNSPQSQRYLAELGLNRGDIQTGTDGFVLRNEKVDAALNRFVNEAVIRPTPGQRPGWQNDPHFALAAQYKGYLYSFFNTISRRVGVELANDNLRVLLPIAMYLPVTMAGEMLRDMAQGDDEEREMFDYAKLGVERSGLLGPTYSTLTDAGKDVRFGHPVLSTIGGATGQQIGKAYDAAISGNIGNTAVSALPASSLFKEWGDG